MRRVITSLRALVREAKDVTTPARQTKRFGNAEKRIAKRVDNPPATLQKTQGKWLDRDPRKGRTD